MLKPNKIVKLVISLLCFLMTLPAIAQLRNVSGTVLDQSGEPVVGASVFVDGTARGTITDADGKFALGASASEKLTISLIGYKEVSILAAQTLLNVTLIEDNEFLDEVVVVGYGVQKKATLTGSVSAINNREIAVTKNENVLNMLTGKIPGVRISQRSSQPGEFDNLIDIRGMGEPLIVVDGIPRDKDYFSRMDANEIESVSVLKDASAAIYGVRAANGVILISTKHGEGVDGKFDITLTSNYGIQSFLYIPQTADAVTHMRLINEKAINNGLTANFFLRQNPTYSYDTIFEYSQSGKKGTNWTEELFNNNVPQQQYNVSIDGGSQKVKYFFNLGYQDQMGSYKSGSLNYNRWNFRSNVDAQITDRLRASIQMSGYMDEKNQPFTDIWAVYKKAWTYRPTSEAYIDGDHNYPSYDDEMLESENPVAATNSDLTGFRREKRKNFNGSIALTYDIPGVEGLKAKAFYSYDYYTTDNTYYKRAYKLYSKKADGTLNEFNRNADSNLRRQTDPSNGSVLQLSLSYDNKFGDHTISALALYEEQYNYWENFYAQRNMLLDGVYLFYGENEGQLGGMNGAGDKSRRSLVGRVNYDYKGKYLVDFTVRYDGTSSFPKVSRWGLFPAVSVGWRASEESFIKDNIDFVKNLKIRASYGMMGDDGGSSLYPQTAVAYNLDTNGQIGYIYNGQFVTGVSATGIPNPHLTWYTAETYNAGLDFDFWNGKLAGSADFFKRERKGLLATSSAVVPGTVGASLPQENIESDMTFGWEITLGHSNRIGEVNYWINGQISATKNRWIYHLDGQAGNSMDNWYRTNVSGRNKDIWFTYEEAGRFENYDEIRYHDTTGDNYGQQTLPGDYYYKDWNGDGVINGADNHPVATFNLPVFNYGINLGADWKGIDISMVWQGAAGVNSSYDEVFTEVGPFNGGAVLDIYQDRWHTMNPTDDPWNPNTQWVKGLYPATGHSFNTGTTGIKNTSYIRLKSLELGYNIPSKWLKVVNIKSLRLYVNAYNLLTFSPLKNIDPERPGHKGGSAGENGGILFYNYPVNRTVNFGATLKF